MKVHKINVFRLFLFQVTKLRCDDCETDCCHSVEIIEGGMSSEYCCDKLPKEMTSNSNAVIVRLHLDYLPDKNKGFVLKWSE